jgi:hypothetical protein
MLSGCFGGRSTTYSAANAWSIFFLAQKWYRIWCLMGKFFLFAGNLLGDTRVCRILDAHETFLGTILNSPHYLASAD